MEPEIQQRNDLRQSQLPHKCLPTPLRRLSFGIRMVGGVELVNIHSKQNERWTPFESVVRLLNKRTTIRECILNCSRTLFSLRRINSKVRGGTSGPRTFIFHEFYSNDSSPKPLIITSFQTYRTRCITLK